MKSVIEQLCAQSPSNSRQTAFYARLYEFYMQNINEYRQSLHVNHIVDNFGCQKMLPEDTILAMSDKGLCLCLLPTEWFIMQYEAQSLKGGHILTSMSKDQCILHLKLQIQEFRRNLIPDERACLCSTSRYPQA